jgi:hypothetical protein
MRSPQNDYAYVAALARIEDQILNLTKVRGISVSVVVDVSPAPSEGHQILLRYGRRTRFVSVDHKTFMDEEFFRTLVLHQMQAAIEELAAVDIGINEPSPRSPLSRTTYSSSRACSGTGGT